MDDVCAFVERVSSLEILLACHMSSMKNLTQRKKIYAFSYSSYGSKEIDHVSLQANYLSMAVQAMMVLKSTRKLAHRL